ncbi:HWE histidine kinase domain-containing protein [Phenylobacterium sp.]|uniref:sensor histidine kinase n=1 Tax=Phenylobacterium sp. TaxID=1871053 RepID=UPI0025D4EA2F|nr:HWE histidine kinase domain-containing protein [Phenylobacterium sp.]
MSEELERENARLAARVAELEAQLAAKPPIDRATLYRTTDNAPWGVISFNIDGRMDYANPSSQRWLTRKAPAIGVPRSESIAPELLAVLEPLLVAAFSGQASESDLTVRDVGGEQRDIRVHIVPRGGGETPINGAVVTLYDVTESQALDRSVRENEARLRHINAVSPTANYIFDFEAGAAVWVAGRTERVYGYAADELVVGGGRLIRQLIHPEDFPRVAERLKKLTLAPDGDVEEFEVRIARREGGWRWVLDRAVAFDRNADGRVTKTLSAALDIDERKRAEERRTLLINELNHRVKNTLASVQSIARQTLGSGRPADEIADIFTGRLIALAGAHDVLTRENWAGAGLRNIVDVALAPFDERRVARGGPDARLDARTALALSMALHELATNASKYGALSNTDGRVELRWDIDETRPTPILGLTWREIDGPPVVTPSRRGFGSRLLTQGVRGELNGSAELEFAADGVVCRITTPLEPVPVVHFG